MALIKLKYGVCQLFHFVWLIFMCVCFMCVTSLLSCGLETAIPYGHGSINHFWPSLIGDISTYATYGLTSVHLIVVFLDLTALFLIHPRRDSRTSEQLLERTKLDNHSRLSRANICEKVRKRKIYFWENLYMSIINAIKPKLVLGFSKLLTIC